MTRPEIIRADSIDLQDRDAPSAKDHTRLNPPGSKLNPNHSLAPHQAETLREVAAETAQERRASWNNGDIGDLQQYAEDLAAGVANSFHQSQTGGRRMATGQQQDSLAIAQNGGHDVTEEDLEGDEDLDDDMMDKISSSPSIEDGGYPFTMSSAGSSKSRETLLSASPTGSANAVTYDDARSSSPYLDPLELPSPLHIVPKTDKESATGYIHHHPHHHHRSGEYHKVFDQQTARATSARRAPQHAGGVTFETKEDYATLDRDRRFVGKRTIPGPVDNASKHEHPSSYRYNPIKQLEIDEGIGGLMDSEMMVPYEDSEDDDEDDDELSLSDVDPRYIDSGWGCECLHDTEDIDFEFVYALHTFVATVEGQANATKGDTMVLLDDSNSYWWLVRVVKDSSIGYLPAEHIETPTERLARLNKHRNIDLSATMLGDQAEKTKNPIKSAMKRRKAKNVTFAAPTIYDYSDIDYSTDEEDPEAEALVADKPKQTQSAAQQDADAEDETAKVEPLKPRAQKLADDADAKEMGLQDEDSMAPNRTSEEIFEASKSGTPGPTRTKDGTVRDSFFKDETVETKKITLTPNLLRDDGAPRTSTESKDLKQRPSLDKVDKDLLLGKDDKKKKDKKEKEKKAGSIRSFFSRKDKKKTSVDEDDDSFGKGSMDIEGIEKEAEELEVQASPDKSAAGPQRQPSKLQKQQPRVEPSPTRKGSTATREPPSGMDVVSFLNEQNLKSVANVPPATMRIVESDTQELQDGQPRSRDQSPEVNRSASQREEKSGLSKIIPSRLQNGEPKPQKVIKAKSRLELDDFDTSEEDEEHEEHEVAPAPQRAAPVLEEKQKQLSPQGQQRPILPGTFPDSFISSQSVASDMTEKPTDQTAQDRLSESPVHVSPATSANPPALMGDTSSQDERSSPISSPSPELVGADDGPGAHRNQDSITTETSATTTSTWNDSSLRSFFDSSSDIRDLLVVVYDKSDVEPADSNHPVVGSLFKEQNARLAEITTQLDNMLGDWLARKQRLRGTV